MLKVTIIIIIISRYQLYAGYLHFMAHIMLFFLLNVQYFLISTFRSKCAVPNTVVFCGSFISYFPGVRLSYFLNDFEMVSAALIFGITFVFHIPHAGWLCRFALVDSLVCLSYLHDVFLLILVQYMLTALLSNFTPVSLHILKCT